MDKDKYIGRLLDNRYEILEVIGTGGMAVVYKARCHRLNRLVAIKILKDDLSQDDEFRRRFHAESQAVAMLSHPNIMSVYDVSTTEEADYIVMELIDGITLKQYMEKKGVLNWKETLHFAMLIAKALEHAHSRGLVHRDIKPHNIMVLKNGSVKVTDFGIARIMSKSTTLTKEALGSVHYISPEQAKGGRVDNRSDLYSLGVVMYEMMTGRPPYDGESPVAVAIQHINGGAAMPSTLNPNIPGGLEQIIMKVMAVEPDKRYPSATALLYDMEEFRKNPTMLFDFNNTPVDDAINLAGLSIAMADKPVQPPRNTAERVARERGERPKPVQRPIPAQPPRQPQRDAAAQAAAQAAQRRAAARREQEKQEKERRTRIVTISVIACSVVAIVAIIIGLVVILSDGGSSAALTPVPNLIGEVYDELDRTQYPDLNIILGEYVFDDEVEAGIIVDQTPAPDTQVGKGVEVRLHVSAGPEPEELPDMMDLSGTTEQAATDYLKSLDLKVLPKQENSDTVKEGYVIRTEPAAGEPMEKGQTVTLWISTGPEVIKKQVPKALGEKEATAIKMLETNSFMNWEIIYEESKETKGEVIRMSAKEGEELDVTTTIILYVSEGAKVPNVLGKSFDDAKKALNDAGFNNIKKETEENAEPKDTVLRQSVNSGEKLDAGTEITLYVSEGVVREKMPKVTGKTFDEAKKILTDAGFKTVVSENVESDQPKGQVVKQSVAADADTDLSTQIVLSVSIGPKVSKKVIIQLPADMQTSYKLTIMLASETLVNDMVIEPGTPSITVDMVGRGVMEYSVFIDGMEYKTAKVDFDSE